MISYGPECAKVILLLSGTIVLIILILRGIKK